MTPSPIGIAPTAPAVPIASMVAIAAGVIAALYLGASVFVPLALAILISFALAPPANRLKRLGLGRVPSVLVVVTLALGLVAGFLYLLIAQAVNLAEDLPTYEQNLREKIRLLGPSSPTGSVFEQTADLLRRMGEELDKVAAADPNTAAAAAAAAPQPIPVEVYPRPTSPLVTMLNLARVVAEPLATVGIALLFIVFVLLERENLRDRFIRLFGASDVHRATEAMNDATSRLGRYLLMQLCINTTYGTLFGIVLFLIGVPNAQLWGLLGIVLRFIPFIGAPISLLLPLTLTLAADAGWTMPLYTVLAFAVIEIGCTYVLEPMLFGSSTGLSPVALIVATAFWTVLWGPVGLLLAAPLTACLVVMGRYVPQLQFLEVLLGNRQVLSPELKIYQRLLAGDPDEAADVAEEQLEQQGFLRTCDEVLLPVLALVAQDRARGVLARDRVQAMTEDVIELADELMAEVAPPRPPSAASTTLCLGAGSRLDDAAARIAAQALLAAGSPVHRLDAPRDRHLLGPVELPPNVPAVLLVAVGPSAPSRARRVVRRLRERYGAEARLIVGLWMLEDDQPLGAVVNRIEADKVVAGLDEALAALGHRPESTAGTVPEVGVSASRVQLTTPLGDTTN